MVIVRKKRLSMGSLRAPTPFPTRNAPRKDANRHLARIMRIPKCTGGSTLPSLDNLVVLSLMSSDEIPLK